MEWSANWLRELSSMFLKWTINVRRNLLRINHNDQVCDASSQNDMLKQGDIIQGGSIARI